MRFRHALGVFLLIFATACGSSSSTSSTTTSPSCAFALSTTAQSVPQGGGTFNATVTMPGSGCNWTASADASWITITTGAAGTATGTVAYTVATNSGAARTGHIVFGAVQASTSLTVTQAGP